MRTALCLMLTLGLGFAFAGSLVADEKKDEKKEVTLKGTILCAKCALKAQGVKKCTNAIQVKEGDKEIVYFFEDKGAGEDYHEALCGGDKKEGTVTGVVAKKDGKATIKPSKVEYKK